MKLNFIIDEDFLALSLLRRTKDDVELESIIEILEEEKPRTMEEIFNLERKEWLTPSDEIKSVLNIVKETEYFKIKLEETKKYSNSISDFWAENSKDINSFLIQTLKVPVDNESNVYISHPSTNIGYSVGDGNILWGHKKGIDDLNYNLTYLVHEVLHDIIKYTESDSEEIIDVKHSIIELISDYELFSQLSKRSTINEGHPMLYNRRMEIYPFWLDYIGLTAEEKIERMKVDNLENVPIIDENLNSLNIFEFVDWTVNNKTNSSEKKI